MVAFCLTMKLYKFREHLDEKATSALPDHTCSFSNLDETCKLVSSQCIRVKNGVVHFRLYMNAHLFVACLIDILGVHTVAAASKQLD